MRGIIFCTDIERGNNQLLSLAERYKLMQISCQVKMMKSGYTLECGNGDYWKVHNANIRALGARCNIAYVERNIDYDTYRCCIAPCMTDFPYAAVRLWGEGNLHIDDAPMLPF